MPNYTFRKKGSKKEYTLTMTISERETYLKENSDVEQVINRMNLCDPVVIGVSKPPSEFQRDVIGRMQKSIPGNNISSRFGIPKEW